MRTLLFAKLTRSKLSPFIEAQASEARTLDIGCANAPYARHFPNRVGFDCVPGTGVDVVGDAHELPFADGAFEQVVCTEVLEHLHTPQQALDEMYRVLCSGGTLILTTRFIFPLHDTPGDYFRYTKYGLRHLLRAWDVISIEAEAGTFETLGILLQRIAFQTELRGGRVTKALVLLIARAIGKLSWLVKKEYGTRKTGATREEQNILSSGYYVIAKKP